MNKNLLLIFTRNPELGKVKTRLAAIIGDKAALNIYTFLLRHTEAITRDLPMNKHVYYSDLIADNDIWESSVYSKRVQQGQDLGQRMKNAFQLGFEEGFKNIIIIGSDMYDLSQKELENAFMHLENNDLVLGPADDGGYYLLGMKSMHSELFKNKFWGTESVLRDTQKDLIGKKVHLLDVKNDVDRYEDIAHIPIFKPFLNHLKN